MLDAVGDHLEPLMLMWRDVIPGVANLIGKEYRASRNSCSGRSAATGPAARTQTRVVRLQGI